MPFVTRLVMVFSSYAPLFALLGLASYSHHRGLALTLWVIAVVSGGLFIALLGLMFSGVDERPVELTLAQSRTEDVGVYATTFLLPFLAISFDRWQIDVALFSFLGFLLLVYIRSRVSYLNPLLLILGGRLFEVEYKTAGTTASAETRRAMAISWRALEKGSSINASRIERYDAGLDILLVRGSKQ